MKKDCIRNAVSCQKEKKKKVYVMNKEYVYSGVTWEGETGVIYMHFVLHQARG